MKLIFKKCCWVLFGALVVLLIVGLLFWWLLPRAEAPSRWAHFTSPPKAERSTLVAPLLIPFAELERRFNDRFPATLADELGKEVKGGLLLDMKAVRKGDLWLQPEGNTLLISVPAAIEARLYRINRLERRERRGKRAPSGASFSAELVIQIKTSFSLDNEWLLQTSSTITHQWISKPQLQVSLASFEVDQMVDKLLADKWPLIAEKFDAKIEERDLLRPRMEKIWTQLNTPSQLSETPPIWLIGEIDTLYAGDPLLTAKGVALDVGLAGRFRIFLGEQSAPRAQPALLPRTKPPKEEGFRLALSAELQWETMSQIANAKLAGQSFQMPRRYGTFTIKGVSLYPSGEHIVVGLSYHADPLGWSTEGIIYLVGVPVLDQRERVLRVENFHYVIRTWDNVLVGANLFAGSQLKDLLQQQLTFPFGERLDSTLEQINEGLNKVVQARGTLSGRLESFTVSGVRLTDAGVLVDAMVFGALSLKANLPPSNK